MITFSYDSSMIIAIVIVKAFKFRLVSLLRYSNLEINTDDIMDW